MQTHGEEQLKLYTEAFVEFDFRPFKRYKRFTHSLFLLVANFILAIMVDPLKEHPEIMTFSMIMGAIASVLLIVLCNNHESSYINRFYHDGLIMLDISISLMFCAYQEITTFMGSKPWIGVLLCLSWIVFAAAITVIRHIVVMKGCDFRGKEKWKHSNSNAGAYGAIAGVLGISLARLMPVQEPSNQISAKILIIGSLIVSMGVLDFLKVYYAKKYHLTADTDTK